MFTERLQRPTPRVLRPGTLSNPAALPAWPRGLGSPPLLLRPEMRCELSPGHRESAVTIVSRGHLPSLHSLVHLPSRWLCGERRSETRLIRGTRSLLQVPSNWSLGPWLCLQGPSPLGDTPLHSEGVSGHCTPDAPV